MNLDTKINIVFTDNKGGKTELISTLKEMLDNDPEYFFDKLDEDQKCTSSSCNNESQNFCDCGSVYEDYDITDIQEAFESVKSEPVYSLLDFKNNRKAPSNLMFCNYDWCSKEGCIDALIDLKKGVHELSTRHGVDLNIDWTRTQIL